MQKKSEGKTQHAGAGRAQGCTEHPETYPDLDELLLLLLLLDDEDDEEDAAG